MVSKSTYIYDVGVAPGNRRMMVLKHLLQGSEGMERWDVLLVVWREDGRMRSDLISGGEPTFDARERALIAEVAALD